MARLLFLFPFDIRDLPPTRPVGAGAGVVLDDGATRFLLGPDTAPSYRPKIPEAVLMDWATLSRDGRAIAGLTDLDMPR